MKQGLAMNRQIDVRYELYGLTEREIGLVERRECDD
jgi:hypothetical protein